MTSVKTDIPKKTLVEVFTKTIKLILVIIGIVGNYRTSVNGATLDKNVWALADNTKDDQK